MDDLRLRPPRHRVDERAVGYWRAGVLLAAAVPVVIGAVLAMLIPAAAVELGAPAAGLAVAGAVAALVLPGHWYRSHRWEVTDTAVHTRSGWLWRETRLAPMSRVQTVDTRRNPLEQRFGLATLVVTTASSRGAVTIAGLDAGVATDLADRLGAVAETVSGDAT